LINLANLINTHLDNRWQSYGNVQFLNNEFVQGMYLLQPLDMSTQAASGEVEVQMDVGQPADERMLLINKDSSN